MKEKIEKYVGELAYVFIGGLKVEVEILDVKITYGKDRFCVTPVAGSGTVWVESVVLKTNK